MTAGPRFLTPDDVATELATSRVQVMALLRSGDLPGLKIGGRGQWRVERARLDDWIAEQYAKTRALIERGEDDEQAG